MKISFCMIAYNETATLRANLAHLYPYAHEIIVCEGSIALLRETLGAGARSDDGTVELLESFPDPLGKLRVIQRDWHDKDEMAAAYAAAATGDILWHVDADEFYDEYTLTHLPREFEDPELKTLCVPMFVFWKSPRYVLADERGQDQWFCYTRVMRRTPGMSATHIPIRRVIAGQVEWTGIREPRDPYLSAWHYAWNEDRRVRTKMQIYARRDVKTTRPGWLANVWDRWTPDARDEDFPDGVHPSREWRLWPRAYRGTHPEGVRDILRRLDCMDGGSKGAGRVSREQGTGSGEQAAGEGRPPLRIGVYIGSWTPTSLGGMGVYLKNLLEAAGRIEPRPQIVLLVDHANRRTAEELGVPAEIVEMHRPSFDDILAEDRRAVARVRRLSYRNPRRADGYRACAWSPEAEAYLWGLDDAALAARVDVLYFTIPPYLKRPCVPAVLTIHDLKHIHRPADHDTADLARRRRWRHMVGAAEVVYSSYDHVRQDVVRHFGVPVSRTAVVSPAVPDDLSDTVHGGGQVPRRTFALMPAQLWAHKNHATVLQAIARLRAEGVEVPLVCTGQTDGECASRATQVARLARALGVADLVKLHGYVGRRELRALYEQARLVIVATHYDPGSFPVMEALAMGKPLVTSRVTSIPETVGDAGLLFDPSDAAQLARAIKRLWQEDELCRELSERGPRRIPRRSWDDVAAEWLRLCAAAAGTRRSNPAASRPVELAGAGV